MAIEGNNSLFRAGFEPAQIPIVIQLVLDSWESYRIPSDDEDKITQYFCKHLRNSKDRSKHFFQIRHQQDVLDDAGAIIGRIDLMFFNGCDEDIYFSFECKRLRVDFPSGFKSLAGEYVMEGMDRYFNGQYAVGLDKGGMIGYVMDGKTNQAIQDVKNAVERRRESLHMEADSTLEDSYVVKSNQVKETYHNYGTGGRFVIYHVFLPVVIISNKN